MKIDRRLGYRLRIQINQVQGLTPAVHFLLENDLSIAWKRVIKSSNPSILNPIFKIDTTGWCAISPINNEKLASFTIVPPKRGKPKT